MQGNQLENESWRLNHRMASFIFFSCGVIISLVLYGILQERIMTIPYMGDRFSVSLYLVFLNRLVAIIVSFPMIGLQGESLKNKAPLWKYIVVSLVSVSASTCQYEALKYVSFPVQILGKTFKMVPIMLWGMIISRKNYASPDWLYAFALTGGTALFVLAGSIEAPSSHANSVYGVILLVLFLVCDGLTSTMQERLFKDYATTQFNQMLYVNLGAAVVSGMCLSSNGGLREGTTFTLQHSQFAMDAFSLSTTSVASQWFILSQLKEFGAVVFAATVNCRQVISILVSCTLYDHAPTILQWHGLVIVFAALLYKSYQGLQVDEKTGESEALAPYLGNTTEYVVDKNAEVVVDKNAEVAHRQQSTAQP